MAERGSRLIAIRRGPTWNVHQSIEQQFQGTPIQKRRILADGPLGEQLNHPSRAKTSGSVSQKNERTVIDQ